MKSISKIDLKQSTHSHTQRTRKHSYTVLAPDRESQLMVAATAHISRVLMVSNEHTYPSIPLHTAMYHMTSCVSALRLAFMKNCSLFCECDSITLASKWLFIRIAQPYTVPLG